MDYNYIYNEQGQKEAIILPIKDWENLNEQENKADKKRLADMIGAAKSRFNSVEDIDAHINKLRDEWS